MTPTAWIIALVAIVVIGLVIVTTSWSRRRRSDELKERFGREYDRTLEAAGNRSKAEADLAERRERVEKLHIRALDPDERTRFVERWSDVQARFVDDPARSVAFADALLADVMKARGYPVSDFDRRAGDISVDHPIVVEHYHKGHEIAVRHEHGEASTEDLRQAMIHYRALFDNLVGATAPASEMLAHEPAH